MGRIMVLGVFTIACILSGCRTKIQYIPVESKTETRDSIIYRDSVTERTIVHERDSTVTKDSTVIIMDDKGNIIRTELYREKERFRELNSDYRLLQARYDSLYQSRQTEIQIPYPVEKIIEVNKLYWHQETLMWIGVGALVILMIWLIKRKK